MLTVALLKEHSESCMLKRSTRKPTRFMKIHEELHKFAAIRRRLHTLSTLHKFTLGKHRTEQTLRYSNNPNINLSRYLRSFQLYYQVNQILTIFRGTSTY